MDTKIFEDIVQKDYKIYVDTSSLMHKDSQFVFFKLIGPLLHKYKRQLILPKSVMNEIYKHIDNHHPDALRVKKIFDKFVELELCVISSYFDEKFVDNAISAEFLQLRLEHNLCLITNDNSSKKGGNLSQDILDLKKARAVENIKDIKVFYLKNKKLYEFKDTDRVNVAPIHKKKIRKKLSKDKKIKCKACSSIFNFTEGEQKFYKEKKLNYPKRCKSCREKKEIKEKGKGILSVMEKIFDFSRFSPNFKISINFNKNYFN